MTEDHLPALTPFAPASMIESVDRLGWGLRVVFYRDRDRHAHIVAAVQHSNTPQESVMPLLRSVEGPADSTWPPSPPLQSMSIEIRPTGSVALMVGMAGRSHWSMSVEAASGRAHVAFGQPQLAFDVACRADGSQGFLGSTYRAVAATNRWLQGDGPSQCTMVTPLGPLHLEATRVILGEATDRTVVLGPASDLSRPSSSIRWTYDLQLIPDHESYEGSAAESGRPPPHNVH